ncbi:DUF2911 domain-containing protein [Flagellimonas meridianipacifica]|uniref:DUF2911 family protein n=1 Tax=Flagellimonas meridianipacifica TaxID=1080225 RepID=A0A2T0M9W7_9FLAO|nr:DUF2911 domain-containing protein [Allomuricauda pacifica]PRX54268.1 Protein of unknown function (DUF2911) [Allomuricauda pacifica]
MSLIYLRLKCLGLTIIFLVSHKGFSQEVDLPNPSPKQTIVQDFGLSSIELTYSRPGAKGRKMIGHVEPNGSVWRTGANAPTKIKFNSTVEILGNTVELGEYVLYTIPDTRTWTVIINKGLENWGSDGYDIKKDVCRVEVPIANSSDYVETFTCQFANVKPEGIDLQLSWENWQITIPITADVKSTLRQQLDVNLSSTKPHYWHAAQFYYEYEANYEKALEMINGAIRTGEAKGLKPYWYYHYKARILKEMGRNKEAMEAANISTNLAEEHGNRNNYLVLNKALIESLEKGG